MKIAIYGTGNRAHDFIEEIIFLKCNCEVIYFVESKRTKNEYYDKPVIEATSLDFTDFDYLVIAVEASREIIEYLKELLPNYDDFKNKIIYEIDFYAIIPEAHRTMPYCSCTLTNGIKYIFSSHDRIIGESMLRTGINFAENQIKAFFELTDKYYGKKARNGYFFDVGANIGTTSIYVKKELNPKLKIIGIEAGKDNYDLFRMNCIANNVEDIKVCHVAFADAAGKAFFNENTDNPGGSSVTKTNNIAGKNCETVNMITFDEFCKKETINSGQIDYIWIDVEGFEVNVLKGAATVLKNKIPMMQEFNPFVYEEKGSLNEYLSIIEGTYNYYMDYSEYAKGKELKQPVSEIKELIEKMRAEKRLQTDLFFIV